MVLYHIRVVYVLCYLGLEIRVCGILADFFSTTYGLATTVKEGVKI